MMRLDKLVGELGIATRSEAKKIIRKGLIIIDGCPYKNPDEKVDEAKVKLQYLGNEYFYKKFHYYMLNKPSGVVSATYDNHDKTVIDIFREKNNGMVVSDLFPLGRLDKDTVGLLVISNDGELAHKLLSPKYHVPKTYYVETLKNITEEDIRILENGVDLGDFVTKEATVKLLSDKSCEITISEGKFHQVKRMFIAVNNEVIYLKRVTFGPLTLDERLNEGEFRELEPDEIERLNLCSRK